MAPSSKSGQERAQFVDAPRREGVDQPRQEATSTEPYKQPDAAPTPASPISWKVSQLEIEVSRVLPNLDADQHAKQALSSVTGMCDLFRKTTSGPELLKQIAAFPTGLALESSQEISPADLKRLPKVKKISVGLWSEFELTIQAGEEGEFSPARLSDTYTVSVRIKGDAPLNPADRFNFFPQVLKLDQPRYILFGHTKAASRMATLLYHELLHIWFTYKYWFVLSNLGGGQDKEGSTGHGAYDPTKPGWVPGFYDLVSIDGGNPTLPFRDMLRPFYSEIDKLEGVTTPTKPTPITPW